MKVLVLLDLDGTLLTAQGEGRESYMEALEAVLPGRTFPELHMAGRTDFGLWQELTGLGPGDDWEAFKRIYPPILERRLSQRPPRLLPGAMELCRALDADPRFQPGIVTGNLAEGSRIKLQTAGLMHWLANVPGAWGDSVLDKSGQAREAAQAWRKVTNEGFRTVVVGDTLADLACARGAAAGCLGVLTGGGSHQGLDGCDVVLPDLSATENVLNELWRIAR
ncbi:MAG: haloacid dehalogenase-like hydrolase [Fibrobacterota bacterium]|nr:haloacid dehalogenase-like hydrolase [Fibrobacterota bacterium]QQS04969.1 MAG: haloacid dehalogenase-like hydrolase [Fibrobacterota bacterium]